MTDITLSESQGLALANYVNAVVRAAVNDQVAAVLREAIKPEPQPQPLTPERRREIREKARQYIQAHLAQRDEDERYFREAAQYQPEAPKPVQAGRGLITLDLDDPATREALLDVELDVLSAVADRMAMAARRRTEGAPNGWKDTIVTKAADK